MAKVSKSPAGSTVEDTLPEEQVGFGRDLIDRPDRPERWSELDNRDHSAADVSDLPLSPAADTCAQRAVDDTYSDSPVERACGGRKETSCEDTAGILDPAGRRIDDPGYGPIMHGEDPRPESSEPETEWWEDAGLGERCMGWVGLDDVKEAWSDLVASGDWSLGDLVGAVGDFRENLDKLKAAKDGTMDSFFHCTANCEASERGLSGKFASAVLSAAKETRDTLWNVIPRGWSCEKSLQDIREDMQANRRGRKAGSAGIRCFEACRRYPHPRRRY